MTAAPSSPPKRWTPEELEMLPDAHRFDLMDGQLVERHMSALSARVAFNISRRVSNHVEPGRVGFVAQEAFGLQMFADDPGRVVFPDGCYFSRETFREEDIPPRGWCRVAPDLVVEVVSPGDNAAAVRAKVRDYLAAGVGLVWVAYPDTRHVDIFRPDGTALTVQGAGVITGEDVIPGFSCPVDEFFPPAGTPAATASSGRRRR